MTKQELVWTSREFSDGRSLIFITGQQGVYDLDSDALGSIIKNKIILHERILKQWHKLNDLRNEVLDG
jgi:hypothetical protein